MVLHLISHPLAKELSTRLRETRTPPSEFRSLLRRLSILLFLEASKELCVKSVTVETPLGPYEGASLECLPALAPVLRAGLGMLDGILDLVPEAQVCHIGLRRDHKTLEAIPYYPPALSERPPLNRRPVFILDPMLATGGSAVAAVKMAQTWNAGPIRLLSIVGAPEGVDRVQANCPDVNIFLVALDVGLNELGYIVPGLGDAGDRQFDGDL